MAANWRGRLPEWVQSVAFVLVINLIVRTFFKGLVDDLIQVSALKYVVEWEKIPVVGVLALGVEWIVVPVVFIVGPILILGPPLFIVFGTWTVLFHKHPPHGPLGWLGFAVLYVFSLVVIWVLGVIGMSYCQHWGTC